ncbi:hypothetical protein CO657_26270 (plasmid) [Rhizobium acidisoli]|uniref:Uncharacterized protein n=1 Tax=Rhizobium acidisoli TaxID=1538158 RepID=A0AAE6C2K6_9HYPH|nr:hypothetical protein [Rhizobium acidisoli]KPH04534.1 hypothetical protein AOG23_32810 [Rhizobium acidisoli]QAS81417.1 hypothetical protein CO657_26270 [Rhizobium acidisoli]
MTHKFRKGDIVTLQAVVDNHYSDNEVNYPVLSGKVSIRVGDQRDTFLVTPDQLEIRVPHFSKGDRIRKTDSKHIEGTVVATVEDKVWVQFDHGAAMGTVDATAIEMISSSAS